MMPVLGDSKAWAQRRLQRHRLRCRQPAQIVHARRARTGVDLLETGSLLVTGRHDQFAAVAIGNAALIAVGVEPLPTFHAELGLQ
jgi:hypothetical protein